MGGMIFFLLTVLGDTNPVFKFQIFLEVIDMGNLAFKEDPF